MFIYDFYKTVILPNAKLVMFITLLCCAFFALHISNFRLDASSETLVLENDQSLQFYRQIKQQYGSDDFLIVTVTPNDELFSPQSISQLTSLADTLVAIDGINSVTSILNVPLVNSPPITLTDLQAQVPTLLSETTDKQLAMQELSASALYRNLLISADAKSVALLLTVEAPKRQAIQAIQAIETIQPAQKRTAELNTLSKAELAKSRQQNQATLIKNVRQVLSQYDAFAQIHLGGLPMITADSIAFIKHDFNTFGIVVLMFIIVTLIVAFKRLHWVLLPLSICVITGAVMVGFLGYADWPVTVVSSNFIALMLILTLSLLIHLIVRYQESHAQTPNASQLELVYSTIKEKLIPCFFTTLTTVVAFGSLTVSDIKPVIEFGWMMSIGVSVAFVLVLVLFPVFVMQLKRGKVVNQQNAIKRFMLWLANSIVNNQYRILLAFALIALLSVFGLNRLSVENRFIDYFKESTQIYKGMILIDSKFGGTTPLDVIIDAPSVQESDIDVVMTDKALDQTIGNGEGDGESAMESDDEDLFAELGLDDEDLSGFDEVKPPSQLTGHWFNISKLEQIRQIHQHLDSIPQTGKVLSLVSGLSLINQVEPDSLTDDFTLEIIYSKLPTSVQEVILSPYLSTDGQQLRFSLRVFESDKTLKRSALLSQIKQDLVTKFNLNPEQIKFTGMLVLYNNMLKSLFDSQIKTLGIVFFCILLMFLVMYRNLTLAIITLTPNVVSALLVLGIMGWANVPLDMMTITIAAICVGIAVDNSIHYIHRFKLEFNQSQDYKQSLINSHESIGRAMFYTTLTITLGFSILAFSNFVPSIYFGLLTGFAMTVAFISNLTLLPLLVLKLKPLGEGG